MEAAHDLEHDCAHRLSRGLVLTFEPLLGGAHVALSDMCQPSCCFCWTSEARQVTETDALRTQPTHPSGKSAGGRHFVPVDFLGLDPARPQYSQHDTRLPSHSRNEQPSPCELGKPTRRLVVV